MVAGGSGLVLILSLFLEWYNVTGKGLAVSAGSQGLSGWESLSFFDILLFLIGVIAVGVAVLRAMGTMPRQLPATPGFIVMAAGGLAVLIVLFRLVSTGDFGHPEVSRFIDIGRSFGIFVAFLAAVGVTIGGWLTWNEEGKPMPGGGARAGAPGAGPAAGAPLGQGQPYGGQPQAPQQPQQQTYAQPAAPAQSAPAAQPAAPAAAAAKADWYPDPRGEKRLRYWDGSQWTDHTAD
jgi:hypothetical protein